MTIRPRRSALYMPGSNARALEKAKTLAADAVILDLEDSVAPDAKEAARDQVAAAVKAGGFGAREVFIRVNGVDTPWHADDLSVAAHAAPDAILVPKVASPDTLELIGRRLLDMGTDHRTRVWAMIETPLAIFNILAIAAAARDSESRLSGFVMGTNDLAKDTRARLVPGRAPMLPWLSTCVAAARHYGIEILDGVYNDIGNAEGFAAECRQGVEFGFDGKTLIHPSQIEPCNRAFSPSADDVAQARKMIAAFDLPENRNKGVVSIDGRMVERLHADMARRTVAIAEAVGKSASS
jgi:citrate lyase subunit beta/citryl-CoA lyase